MTLSSCKPVNQDWPDPINHPSLSVNRSEYDLKLTWPDPSDPVRNQPSPAELNLTPISYQSTSNLPPFNPRFTPNLPPFNPNLLQSHRSRPNLTKAGPTTWQQSFLVSFVPQVASVQQLLLFSPCPPLDRFQRHWLQPIWLTQAD